MPQTNIHPKQAINFEKKPNADLSLANWIFEKLQPFVKGRVLEVGSCYIAEICKQREFLVETLPIDLCNDSFDLNHMELPGLFDTIIILDVKNCITNNHSIISNYTKLLKQGGYLLIRLPARTALFNELDQGLKYWQEDNLDFINKSLNTNYEIVKVRYFIIGSIQQMHFQKSTKFKAGVALFDNSNDIELNQIGLSILVVGLKR